MCLLDWKKKAEAKAKAKVKINKKYIIIIHLKYVNT